MTLVRTRLPRPSSLASPWSTPGLVVVAVLLTFLLTAGPILMAGANPIDAYVQFLIVPLTSRFSILEVLVASTPILLTGTAVALAFRGGYWNIGAEGQLLVGAIVAAALGQVSGLPQVVQVPLIILGGAHDLSGSVRRQYGETCEYLRVTTRGYRAAAEGGPCRSPAESRRRPVFLL